MTPPDIFTAAKIIAQVFTAAGVTIHLPGEGAMDDAKRGRWHACLDSAEAILRLRAASHEAELLAACEIIAKAELYDPVTGIIDADVLEACQEAARAAIAKVTGEPCK